MEYTDRSVGNQILMFIVFTIVSFLIYVIVSTSLNLVSTEGLMFENTWMLRALQAFSSIIIFALAPLMLSRYCNVSFSSYYSFTKPQWLNVILVICIVFYSMPFITGLGYFNSQLSLPDSLSSLEAAMKTSEQSAMGITYRLLGGTSITTLFANIIVIAIIPALSEELFFRGALQPLIFKLTNNIHVAVWITAIIFSAIHMQFYGFFPRMVLGAICGYLYAYTKSLWMPVLAHFINNSVAVLTYYIYQLGGIADDPLSDSTMEFSPIAFVVSLIITVTLLLVLRNNSLKKDKFL